MSKLIKLLAKIDFFCKVANSSDVEKFIKNHQDAMHAEFNAGIRVINRLYSTTNPNYRNTVDSPGLETLHNSFGQLNNLTSKLGEVKGDISSAKEIVQQMCGIIGNASFFTSPSNAGTGYDPSLTQGGAASPAAYLERAKTHLTDLDSYLKMVQPVNPNVVPTPPANMA